jgi:hypothetical protein
MFYGYVGDRKGNPYRNFCPQTANDAPRLVLRTQAVCSEVPLIQTANDAPRLVLRTQAVCSEVPLIQTANDAPRLVLRTQAVCSEVLTVCPQAKVIPKM